MNQNYLFVITSVINFKDKPLPYSKTRSVFTAEERIKQTLGTIKSIRNKVPKAKIILLELGDNSPQFVKLQNITDEFVFLGKNPLVKLAVNSAYRGLGEAVGLIFGYRFIKKYSNYYTFKISGRYTLNNNFTQSRWVGRKKISAKLYNKSISTRLYGFDYFFLDKWFVGLILSVPALLFGKMIEAAMYSKFKKSLNRIDRIGVSGKISIDGSEINE